MSYARHCDRDGCDTWQRLNSNLPDEWLTVSGVNYDRDYCCRWCLVVDQSKDAEPTEEA